jgi:hypothetical protein
MTPYDSVCDDFALSVHLTSKVELPTHRETVLHFFESVRRRDPRLTDFERRDSGEYVLEQDRDSGRYRWLALDGRRLTFGFVNPSDLSSVDTESEWLLDVAPHHLDITGLDAEVLELLYTFDLPYAGNHDEVVAEALAVNGPFEGLIKATGGQLLLFQPAVMLALDDACQLQCRVNVETRTTAYQVRTGNYSEAPVSVYASVRQFWSRQPYPRFAESYYRQREILDQIVMEQVLPGIVQPLAKTIAAKQ